MSSLTFDFTKLEAYLAENVNHAKTVRDVLGVLLNNPDIIYNLGQEAHFWTDNHRCTECPEGDRNCDDCFSQDTDFEHSSSMVGIAKEIGSLIAPPPQPQSVSKQTQDDDDSEVTEDGDLNKDNDLNLSDVAKGVNVRFAKVEKIVAELETLRDQAGSLLKKTVTKHDLLDLESYFNRIYGTDIEIPCVGCKKIELKIPINTLGSFTNYLEQMFPGLDTSGESRENDDYVHWTFEIPEEFHKYI